MQHQDWIEDEAETERTEKRRATAHEQGVEPGICDILAQTPEKTWCDLEDEDCEK